MSDEDPRAGGAGHSVGVERPPPVRQARELLPGQPPVRKPGAGRVLGRTVRRHPRAYVGAFAALVVAGFGLWGLSWYLTQAGGRPGGAPAVLEVAKGDTMAGVTATLRHDQVIGSTVAFRLWLAIGGTPTVQPGNYLVRRDEPYAQITKALRGGPDVFPVQVDVGYTLGEIAKAVGEVPGHSAARFAAEAGSGAVRSPWDPPGSRDLEGLVAPGTYLVLPGEADRALLQQMVDRFDAEADAAGLASKASALGITPYQAVVVASIVEKEGVYPQNVAKVARVVYNRLAAQMPLQMDSTVLYAEGRDGGPVTEADLALHSPYNTYLTKGLTPTPICVPSAAALQAALAPAPGGWLWFELVKADGTEAFETTYAQHLADIAAAKAAGLP